MTREEQIRQAGIEYTIKNRPMCIGGGAFSKVADEMNRNRAFEESAKWADKTTIENACEYLRIHLWQNVDDDNDPIVESVHNITLDNFIKEFTKSFVINLTNPLQ